MIIFDMDGTLTPSRCPMESETTDLFISILNKYKVAVISGGGFIDYERQLLSSLPINGVQYKNLLLLPTSGTKLYTWKGQWCEEYSEHLTNLEKNEIIGALNHSLRISGYQRPEKIYGNIIDDRGSQISFSGLGDKAPLKLKDMWDPTHEKRKAIVSVLQKRLSSYDIRIAGTTTIDITKKGINKAYGIRKLEEFTKIPIEEMLFVGDAMYPGGNDYTVKATSIDCVQVAGPNETRELIQLFLG